MLDTPARGPVTDLRLRLRSAGYDPIACEGKIPSMCEWEKKIGAGAEEIAMWEVSWPDAHNTGIICKRSPAIDIDLLHADAAAAIEALAREFFEHGIIIVRFGLAPKRAILLRTDEPFKKIVARFVAPNGAAQKIEILADGQQVVAFGIHPDTRKPYEWFGGSPGKIARAELPYVREADMRRFLAAAAEMLVKEHGYTHRPEPPKGNAGADTWRRLVIDGVADGDRNNAATRLAGHLLRRFVDPHVVLELVTVWNEAKCRPALPPGEIITIVNSIARRELARRQAR
jgi:hypothetical protein